MRFLAAMAVALCFAGAAFAQPVKTGHLEAELVSSVDGVAPGQTIHVALRQKIQPHWHTYWRNSGDSGEATKLIWTLPAGWKAGEFVWPAPRKLPVGPLMNYGYEGEVLLPVTVTAPATAKPGDTVTLAGKAQFLVCADICVPEDAELKLALPVTAGPAAPNAAWGGAITKALADAPKPGGFTAAWVKEGDTVKLAITGAALKGVKADHAYFYPYDGTVIDHARPQAIERGPEGLTLALAPGYEFQSKPPTVIDGVLEVAGKVYEVGASAGSLPPGAAGLGPARPAPVTEAEVAAAAGGGAAVRPAAGADLGLAAAALFALIGGLILNLMPCVFPVLAMKAASLAGHGGGAHAEARRQGLAFGAGVLLSFLSLAVGLIALKAGGAAVGWGFQLQSPPVVAALALLMLAVGLNLSGVFEMGTSLQGVGSGLAARGGLGGSFFTGVLAVVVAAPCTAPFMGPAMGWALTQPALSALVVFTALAIGFAAPFVAVAFAPALLDRLPGPGPWMDVFKKALAFPMYGAAVWLVWVLTVQAGSDAVPRILGAAVLVGLAAWLAGIAQRRMFSGQRAIPQVVATVALVAVAVFAAVGPPYRLPPPPGEATLVGEKAQVAYEAHSPERLAELRAEGRPVFVNYTAAWCVSCQVNDRVALSTKGVAAAMAKHNVAYLKADWTNRNAEIAADLARFGRAGVPLYLVYGAKGGEPVILPAILTEGAVVKALDAAAG